MVQHVSDIGWRADGDHGLGLGNAVRRSEHGSATQRMPDENCGSVKMGAQMVCSEHQVLYIGGEIGALKLSLGGSEPREVEPQHRNSERGQLGGNAAGRNDVLRAGKAMREQRVSADIAGRQVQTRGQLVPEAAGEGQAKRACNVHDSLH
jgi:hypothetical protein